MAENTGIGIDVQDTPARQRHYPIDARHNEIGEPRNEAHARVCRQDTAPAKERSRPRANIVRGAGEPQRETGQLEVDVFFSHSSKDKEWVAEIATRLEAEHGLVCSYDFKDFIGGKHITTNILNCVKMSRKTVLVITPDFLESRWCDYETQVVFQEQLFRKENVAVPVLLKTCVIPAFIAHLTYLEVEDPQFWEKFVEILTSQNTEEEVLAERLVSGLEESNFNGKSLAEAKPLHHYCCPGFDFADIHEMLNAKGIRVNKGELKELQQLFVRSPLHKFYCCFTCSQSVITFGCCAGIAIILSVCLLTMMVSWIVGWYYVFTEPVIIIVGPITAILVILLLLAIMWLVLPKRIPLKSEAALNLHLMDHKVILGVVRKHRFKGKQTLHFIYFKKSQCLEFLEKWLAATKKHKVGHVMNDIEDNQGGDVQEELVDATAILIGDRGEEENKARLDVAEICGAYVRNACADKLNTPRLGQRHTTKGMCLCQFVQAKKYDELV